MVQCEMCGAETASPRTAKIEGAELDVCDDCVDFGTEIRQSAPEDTTTKYSTSPSSSRSSAGGSSASTTATGGSSSRRRRDPFEDLEEIVSDYDQVIREGREAAGLSREELGRKLSEKASLIGKLERGESLPSDDVRRKLERALGIDLIEGAADEDDADWSASGEARGMTLGDVVERKD